MSFVIFSYKDIQWGNREDITIGFRSGDNSYLLPASLVDPFVNITTTSNVGVPGLFVYRVDQMNITLPSSDYTGKQFAYTNTYMNLIFKKEDLTNFSILYISQYQSHDESFEVSFSYSDLNKSIE